VNRDVTPRCWSYLALARYAGYACIAALVAALIVGTIRISIPTRTVVRVMPWVSDPVGQIDAPTLELATAPLIVRADPGSDVMRRIDLFTVRTDQPGNADLRVTINDARSGAVLAHRTVKGRDVVDSGITIVEFPLYESTDTVDIALSAPNGNVGVRELPAVVPGFSTTDARLTPGYAGVALRSYAYVPEARARLRTMYDRSLARWPQGNRTLIPITLIVGAATVIALLTWLLSTLVVGVTWRTRVGSTLVVIVMITPVIRYVLVHRTG
jgi:hypothetical protein